MRFEFDPDKSARNARLPGLPLAGRLFDTTRLEWEDRRKDHGEIRINTLGEIEGRVFCASFTRRGDAIRIISFRKANAREASRYCEYLRRRSAHHEG